MALKAEVGRVYGRLTVLEDVGRSRNGHQQVRCKCTCGYEKLMLGSNIASGFSRSCGCQKGSKLPDGEAQGNYLYKRYRRQARERSFEFNLTKEQFLRIICQACFYCGEPPKFTQRESLTSGLLANGIDRKEPKQGYSVDNCVPCCFQCNRAKSDMPFQDFKAWATRLGAKFGSV